METHTSARATGPRNRCLAFHRRKNDPLVPDARHTTCTAECDMWIDTVAHACVCRHSLAVHICGRECTIPPRALPNGEGYVCPLTNIQVQPGDLTATPLFDADGRNCNHWSAYRRTAKRKRRPCTRKASFRTSKCQDIMLCVLDGPVKHKTRDVQILRARKSCEKKSKSERKRTGRLLTFAELKHVVNTVHRSVSPALRPANFQRHIARMAVGVCAYMRRHPQCFKTSTSEEVVACAWLTMFSTGLEKNGTVIIKKDDLISDHIPPPALMSNVPQVQCRSISVAVRHFRAYVFTQRGNVVQSRTYTGINGSEQGSRVCATGGPCREQGAWPLHERSGVPARVEP